MKKQTGFTLVEIAIVLVIIGLLLGGVLKGQEIFKNAKIKNIENAANGVATALYTYQDRYRALPGDDVNSATRLGATATAPAGAGKGNGKIEGQFNSTTATDESVLFWLHLRNAGLVAGKNDDTSLPANAFSGITGVSTGSEKNGGPADSGTSIPGLFVGFSEIPGDIVLILESRADDSTPKTGTLQSYVTTGTDGAAYTVTAGGTGTSATLHSIYFAL